MANTKFTYTLSSIASVVASAAIANASVSFDNDISAVAAIHLAT